MNPAAGTIKRWRRDPAAFVRECLKAEPDAWQLGVLQRFPAARRQALKACKGPGKTTILSWLAWNFLATRPYPKLIATSISKENLADGLWTEMAKWQAKSEFLKQSFEWNKQSITSNDHPETWWMVARAWSKSADRDQQANTLAGKHADYMLFILDEVGGIPDSVMAAAEAALATGIETKILMAGNPTHNEGPLYRACTTERNLWDVTEITSDPDDPQRTPRVSKEWAREQIQKYGRDNPWVLVNVFGKFPPSSLNSLLGPDEVELAMRRHIKLDDYQFAQKRLGIDVARFGDDSTVLFPRQGLAAFAPAMMRNARSNEIASRVALAKTRFRSEAEFIDDTGGYASGVIDSLILAGHPPIPVNFAGKADDSRYFNKRAEMYFRMAEWVKGGGSLPNVPELVGELTTPAYFFSGEGKFQIEEKDQIKIKLGRSPDHADALALTFAHAESAASHEIEGILLQGRKLEAKMDFDPFA